MRISQAQLALGGLLALWCATLFFLSFGTQAVFLSPDENAVFVFARAYAQTGSFVLAEPLNASVQFLLFPRSAIPAPQGLVPTTFLLFPALLGTILKYFGTAAIYMVTPLLAVIAVFAIGDMTWRITRQRVTAVLAGFIAAVHPALWYYAARPLMHNVAFAALLVIGVWFGVRQPFSRVAINAAFSGLTIGSALCIRPSEAPWIILSVFLFACLSGLWRRLRLFDIAVFAAFSLLSLVALLGLQEVTYGNAFSFGYLQTTAVLTSSGVSSAEIITPSFVTKLFSLIFPFGIVVKAMVKHAVQYGFLLYPLFSALMVIGAILFVQAPSDRRVRFAYVVTIAFASLWLIALYGSWTFNDNPDPFVVTVGNSYVRYFLPLFLFSAPLGAYAITSFAQRLKPYIPESLVIGVVSLALLVSGAMTVFGGDDGFLRSREVLAASAAKRAEIVRLTEPEAVVVVDRADKFLFPYRRVVQPLRAETTYAAMPLIVSEVPLYYFGITLPQQDIDYLNEVKLADLDLRIDEVQTIGDETLYQISSR
ncbi:hypothetical protein KBC55_02960 [Patescibacteria group bacterium]|nr:hypothetical protein [Patescibacteria group bacterium]